MDEETHMSDNDEQPLRDWDEESMHALFAASDEVTRSLLSYLARPEHAGGVRQQQVGRALELQRYIKKAVRDLKRRARQEYRRRPLVTEAEPAEGRRSDPSLVMPEKVARLVREAEQAVDATAPVPDEQAAGVAGASEQGGHRGAPEVDIRDRPEVIRVYEAGRGVGIHPIAFVRSLWERRKLMFVLARSAIKAQSNHTILGQLWIFLDPVLFAATYVILVGILRGGELGGGRIQRLIFSLFLFAFTRLAMQQGAGSIRGNQGLLMNSSFPRALLPTTPVLQAFLQLLPSLALYAVVHVATGLPVGPNLLALPGLLFLQIMFSLGLAMILATVTVYVPDVQQMLRFVTRLWMYTTPVLYSVDDLRGNLEAVLAVIKWNPLFYLFAGYHRVLDGQLPTSWQVLVTSAWASAFLVAGFLVFSSKERELATRV